MDHPGTPILSVSLLQAVTNPKITKTKEGKQIDEYKENEWDDLALRVLHKQIYRLYRVSYKQIII